MRFELRTREERAKSAIVVFTAIALASGAVATVTGIDQGQIAPAITQAKADAEAISPDPSSSRLAEASAARDKYNNWRVRLNPEFNPERDVIEAQRPSVLLAAETLEQHQAHLNQYRSIAQGRGNLLVRQAVGSTTFLPALVLSLTATIMSGVIAFEQQASIAFLRHRGSPKLASRS